jgi:hypothetical protein
MPAASSPSTPEAPGAVTVALSPGGNGTGREGALVVNTATTLVACAIIRPSG